MEINRSFQWLDIRDRIGNTGGAENLKQDMVTSFGHRLFNNPHRFTDATVPVKLPGPLQSPPA